MSNIQETSVDNNVIPLTPPNTPTNNINNTNNTNNTVKLIAITSDQVIPQVVYQALQLLVTDPQFINDLETSVKNIMKDNKVDQYDIPEIVFLITNICNQRNKLKLSSDDLPLLIKLIYNYVVEKLNLIPNDRRADFERLLESTLKLVMMQPVVSKTVNSCFSKVFKCCGSADITTDN